jgi:Flp pilus assembly protein TadD
LAPRNAAVHALFGMVALEENLLEEAYQSLRQAVSLAPENADYNYALGMVAEQRADPGEAVPFFKKYRALRPDDPRGALQLGVTYFYAHQEDAAKKELEEAARHRETAATARFFLGRIANQEGKFAVALHELQEAIGIEPNYADPYAEQGIIYMKEREYAAAEKALLRAVSLDPDHYAANLNLMMLYQRTGSQLAGEQTKRFERVKRNRAERARLSLRSIQIVR